MSAGVMALRSLCSRELTRFSRQPARIVASIGTPAIIWVVLASGLGGSFMLRAMGGEGGSATATSYGAYLVAGMAAMSAVFTSIFAAMSLIEDRAEGFLQAVLVSPAPSWAMVGAKVFSAALVASMQSGVIILASPLAGVGLDVASVLVALAGVAMMALGITGLGLALAWKVNSTSGFHGVMNLVLMPMLLLSGAFFPMSGASAVMAVLMKINPLTWPSELIRTALLSGAGSTTVWQWALSAVFAVLGAGLGLLVMGRGRGE